MYKILHIFRIEKFTSMYLEFIYGNFDKKDHEFWLYGEKGQFTSCFKYRNVRYIRNINMLGEKQKIKEMQKFDKIIYHGVFDPVIVNVFYKHKKLLKKLYLYFWGGDKAYFKDESDNRKKMYVVRNAKGIITIIPEEKKYIVKNYNPRGRLFHALYDYPNDVRKLMENGYESKKKNYIAVQIGNSATKTNAHISILKKIEKYKDENIKIFVPLSYGDKEYANKVIKIGREMFGEKFVAITEFMDICAYHLFMQSIDIAIFGMRRQQALGNIEALLCYGKKVYLQGNGILEHYYNRVHNCYTEKIQAIDDMTFEQFVDFSEEYRLNNEKKIKENLAVELRIKEWKAIFDDKI